VGSRKTKRVKVNTAIIQAGHPVGRSSGKKLGEAYGQREI
jgi:hypothetical protein